MDGDWDIDCDEGAGDPDLITKTLKDKNGKPVLDKYGYPIVIILPPQDIRYDPAVTFITEPDVVRMNERVCWELTLTGVNDTSETITQVLQRDYCLI